MNLITDRAQSNVARVNELMLKIRARTASPAEWEEWLGGLKGAYNAADYNRVGQAIAYLSEVLNSYGHAIKVSPKTDWNYSGIPTPAQQESYLADVRALKSALPAATPVPESMEQITFEQANDIERVLLELEQAIEWMIASFRYSNQYYSGEAPMHAKIRKARRLTWGEIEQQFTWQELQKHTWNEIMYGLGGEYAD